MKLKTWMKLEPILLLFALLLAALSGYVFDGAAKDAGTVVAVLVMVGTVLLKMVFCVCPHCFRPMMKVGVFYWPKGKCPQCGHPFDEK